MLKKMKNAFRPSGAAAALSNSQPSEPRELKEINADYSLKCAQLGQVEYRISCDKEQAYELRQEIKKLNLEGAARNKLDAEKQKLETVKLEAAKLEGNKDV